VLVAAMDQRALAESVGNCLAQRLGPVDHHQQPQTGAAQLGHPGATNGGLSARPGMVHRFQGLVSDR